VDTLFGLDRLHDGQILINGKPLRRLSPGRGRRRGLGYVPQDRKTQGIIPIWDLRFRKLRRWSQGILLQMSVVPANSDAPVTSLSGGNQQKVIFGRTIARKPSVLLLLEPTRGIDVRAKAEIANVIRTIASNGAGVLVVDSELTELLAVCDRIYVMHRGALVGELSGEAATEETITLLAAGGGLTTTTASSAGR
jgi:ABC-type sugar transport system ATPase subunit